MSKQYHSVVRRFVASAVVLFGVAGMMYCWQMGLWHAPLSLNRLFFAACGLGTNLITIAAFGVAVDRLEWR